MKLDREPSILETTRQARIVFYAALKADSDGHQHRMTDEVVCAIGSLWNKEACG